MARIDIVTEVTPELVDAFARLVPQLSSAAPPGADELAALVAQPGTTVFIAVDDKASAGPIIGTLTLVTFRIPTGMRAWIEDVVVDEASRGGVGKALTAAALDRARELGCRTVELTSRPSREAANALYLKLGFEIRETNVYRYDLGPA